MARHTDLCKTLTLLVVLATSTLPGCTPTTEVGVTEAQAARPADAAPTAGGPPPLVVDTGAPLLLDEPTADERAAAAAHAQTLDRNAACLVCHANYATESLALRHAEANLGCVNCHGASRAHRNDENNTTPPETMYTARRIDSFCRRCHPTHDVPPNDIITRWLRRSADQAERSDIVCTDCHGQHRMRVRTIIWDKDTGELLRTNRGNQ